MEDPSMTMIANWSFHFSEAVYLGKAGAGNMQHIADGMLYNTLSVLETAGRVKPSCPSDGFSGGIWLATVGC